MERIAKCLAEAVYISAKVMIDFEKSMKKVLTRRPKEARLKRGGSSMNDTYKVSTVTIENVSWSRLERPDAPFFTCNRCFGTGADIYRRGTGDHVFDWICPKCFNGFCEGLGISVVHEPFKKQEFTAKLLNLTVGGVPFKPFYESVDWLGGLRLNEGEKIISIIPEEKTMKLRYRLEKFEKGLVFQVLEMDERFRNLDTCSLNSYEDSDTGIEVTSDVGADVCDCGEEIWLRGSDKEDDLDIATTTFADNDDRDDAFDNIQKGLKSWAKNWEGFKEDVPATKELEPGTYEI